MSVPKVFYGILSVERRAPSPVQRAALIRARRRFLLRSRNHFLRGRTKVTVGTKRAVISGIRRKLSLRNAVRGLLYAHFRCLQLGVVSRREHRHIVFEVMEDQ